MPDQDGLFYWVGEICGLICFDLSTLVLVSLLLSLETSALRQGRIRQIATVDHGDRHAVAMRGLVTDLTSLRRGAVLCL